MQPFSFFFCWLFVGGGGDLGSGSGSKFNCAARVGSGWVGLGQTISGTGRVRASVLSPCRPLVTTLDCTQAKVKRKCTRSSEWSLKLISHLIAMLGYLYMHARHTYAENRIDPSERFI